MKVWKLLLLSLVPAAVGEVCNRLFMAPGMGTALFYVQTPAVAVFCFWLGRRCVRRGNRFLSALALTQWPSVVSLGLYLWQFHLCGEETRSMFLAGLSQSAGAPLFSIAARIVMPFSGDSWGPPETLAGMCVSLALLAILFSCGYWWGRTGWKSGAPTSE